MTYFESVAWELAWEMLNLDDVAWNDCYRDEVERKIDSMKSKMSSACVALAHKMADERRQMEADYYAS